MRFIELLEYKQDITLKKFGQKFFHNLYTDLGATFSNYDNPLLTKFHNEVGRTSFENVNAIQRLYYDLYDVGLGKQPEQDTLNYFEKSELELNSVVKELHNFVADQLQGVEQADPSNNKQYVLWMLRLYISSTITSNPWLRYEDILSNVAEFLYKYHTLKIKRKLPPELADINRVNIDNYNQVEDRIQDLYDEVDPESALQVKGKSIEIADTENLRIIQLEDQPSACYYGRGTKWCTAATKGVNYFNHYKEKGNLYVLIPKQAKHNGEKYQIQFESDSFMNEEDREVSKHDIVKRFNEDPALVDLYNKYHNGDYLEYVALIGDARDLVESYDAAIYDLANDLFDKYEPAYEDFDVNEPDSWPFDNYYAPSYEEAQGKEWANHFRIDDGEFDESEWESWCDGVLTDAVESITSELRNYIQDPDNDEMQINISDKLLEQLVPDMQDVEKAYQADGEAVNELDKLHSAIMYHFDPYYSGSEKSAVLPYFKKITNGVIKELSFHIRDGGLNIKDGKWTVTVKGQEY